MPEFQPERQIFEQEAKNEVQYSRTTEIFDQVKMANSKSEGYKKNLELQKRQKDIVFQLPEDFLGRLETHLEEGRKDAEKHGKLEKFNNFTYILGEIFENIVEIEDEHYDLFPNHVRYLQTEKDKKAAKILLDVMQKGSITNPDILKLVLENGSYKIRSAIEAKTHLDERAFGQLGRDGFKKGFQEIIDKINEVGDPTKFGLEVLPDGFIIEIDSDYFQELVIPRDLEIENQISEAGLSDYEQEEFVEMLTSGEDVIVGRSAFSREELKDITQWALGQIYLKQQNKQ